MNEMIKKQAKVIKVIVELDNGSFIEVTEDYLNVELGNGKEGLYVERKSSSDLEAVSTLIVACDHLPQPIVM